MWSEAFDAILTTLRYLAPATLLTLFWGQQSFLFKLLKHIDSAFRAIVFSSEEQKQAVLQWLAEAGPVRVEHLDTVWRHGWILCGVLDAAMPGACAGHPPTRLSLKHAQAIADHYLGVEPVFSRQELERTDSLSKHQEWKFATYLERIREALAKLTPPVSKPPSQRTSPETPQYTLDYVAKGSGLAAAQVNNKMYFKIYTTSQQSLDPGEITILIRGPKDTYGMTVLPPILGKAQIIRQKLMGLHTKSSYTENALPITQGTTYLRNYGKNDMYKTYHIPKSKYDIEIDEDIREDHAKIGYVVNIEGRYEIFITSKGQNVVGSPFTMTASSNIFGILENDSFCLEDGEEIDILDVTTDRKVVLRIVDFVTEKMLLKENGALEKISDDEAKYLMSTDTKKMSNYRNIRKESSEQDKTLLINHENMVTNFKTVASKVVQMNRVCKIIRKLTAKHQNNSVQAETLYSHPRNHQIDIPDIVNSTFNDTTHPFILDSKDKFIIPENISVSLRTEKSYEEETNNGATDTSNVTSCTDLESSISDNMEIYESIPEFEEDILINRPMSSNPFLNDILYEQDFGVAKDLGSFVKSEYEANNSQNEEIDTTIKIMVQKEESPTLSSININPFTNPIIIERPKTPILKIITGQIKDPIDSVFVQSRKSKTPEEIPGNEFINPFFAHHHQTKQPEDMLPITDFIIGAPVSLPPIIRASTPEPVLQSFLITQSKNNNHDIKTTIPNEIKGSTEESVALSIFSTPLHANTNKANGPISSTFHSLESNLSENVEILDLPLENNVQETCHIEVLRTESNSTPKKDMWDSAYVSIDENNSSPDTNNNDNIGQYDTFSKQKFAHSDDIYQFSNMGPAEREIWQTCTEIKHDTSKIMYDEIRSSKKDTVKQKIFTPIIEESDRYTSTSAKDIRRSDFSSVPVAFTELNDIYHEQYQTPESNLKEIKKVTNKSHIDLECIGQNKSIDSASEVSDVKRYATELEGKISEVQKNVTESVSVSQTLRDDGNVLPNETLIVNSNVTKFGDSKFNNIVLEKKRYWDQKIREIEENTEENRSQQKKRRLSSKHLRHNDSLSKKRGKQIIKNILEASDNKLNVNIISNKNQEICSSKSIMADEIINNVKLVDKWKRYWDNKLETDDQHTDCLREKNLKNKEMPIPLQAEENFIKHDDLNEVDNIKEGGRSEDKLPVKQELPEEVFKAFETSPKRFFGTSRKQILSKFDVFLGNPSTVDESLTNVNDATHDTGLVSSRISLFHNISHTAESPRQVNRKCQSMHNISQRKDSENSMSSTNENLTDQQSVSQETSKASHENIICSGNLKTEVAQSPRKVLVKDKRARIIQNTFNQTIDETTTTDVTDTITNYNKQRINHETHNQDKTFRKLSSSKSEMDIFSKISNKPPPIDDLEKYKSCDELPKINVKNFISLYESASRSNVKAKPDIKARRTSSLRHHSHNSFSGGVNNAPSYKTIVGTSTSSLNDSKFNTGLTQSLVNIWPHKSKDETIRLDSTDVGSLESVNVEIVTNLDPDNQTTYLSLSDIELEIVENTDKVTIKPMATLPASDTQTADIDYKSRFKLAKQFFQSLEELRVEKKPKLNECEMLLTNNTTESPENDRPKKRIKKNIKAHSMPSTEISKIWNQLQDNQTSETKLVKISEKFNVDDLFSDVTEGKLSRQGSLRGIPHKKAVLEAFRSMENLIDHKTSSYEIAITQLNDFADENKIKNAQTYLSEYPYLPTTDPAKYHSRLDTKASGLISLKELINQKPRRNSVPDLRLNTKFTVEL